MHWWIPVMAAFKRVTWHPTWITQAWMNHSRLAQTIQAAVAVEEAERIFRSQAIYFWRSCVEGRTNHSSERKRSDRRTNSDWNDKRHSLTLSRKKTKQKLRKSHRNDECYLIWSWFSTTERRVKIPRFCSKSSDCGVRVSTSYRKWSRRRTIRSKRRSSKAMTRVATTVLLALAVWLRIPVWRSVDSLTWVVSLTSTNSSRISHRFRRCNLPLRNIRIHRRRNRFTWTMWLKKKITLLWLTRNEKITRS